MPNAKVLSEKQAIVESLAERLQKAQTGIIIDYKGITVAEDTEVRTEFRKAGVEYTVVKNTLTKKALEKIGLNGLEETLNGTTSIATASEDAFAPFRIVTEYSKKLNDRFNVKGAFMEGQVLDASKLEELAAIPSKEALYSMVLGTMLAPITSLAVVLGQILEQKGGSLEAPAAEAAE